MAARSSRFKSGRAHAGQIVTLDGSIPLCGQGDARWRVPAAPLAAPWRFNARLAHLAERLPCKKQATRSIRVAGSHWPVALSAGAT